MTGTPHTPTPWARNGFNLCELIVVRDGPDASGQAYIDGRHQVSVGRFEKIEDAAFAERAVNAHDDLVKAIEGVIRVADRQTDEFAFARAALAKAGGAS